MLGRESSCLKTGVLFEWFSILESTMLHNMKAVAWPQWTFCNAGGRERMSMCRLLFSAHRHFIRVKTHAGRCNVWSTVAHSSQPEFIFHQYVYIDLNWLLWVTTLLLHSYFYSHYAGIDHDILWNVLVDLMGATFIVPDLSTSTYHWCSQKHTCIALKRAIHVRSLFRGCLTGLL